MFLCARARARARALGEVLQRRLTERKSLKVFLSRCSYEMETQITFICLFLVMLRFSPGEGLKNLTGVVGGNVTLPDPLLELGFLSDKINTFASVSDKSLQFVEERYNNKLHWNKTSGLFTLTGLQKNDSGTYKIDSKRGLILTVSYSLTVYDPAPTPAVTAVDVTSDLCLLTCSVDKPATLLWIRDQEIQNQNRSALYLTVTVHKEDRASSYRCAAANPAENKTVDVDVRILCGFNETETLDDRRSYWIPVVVSVVLIGLVAVVFLVMKKKFLGQKSSASQTQGSVREEEVQYTPIRIKDKRQNQEENIPEPSGSSDNNLTTVYAKLEHPIDQNQLTANS